MPQICPRCTKILPGDPEDGSIHTCTPTDYARNLEARVAELEAALRDALGSFKCTQRVLSYPESHWSRRACALLNEEPEQPGYITFVRP